MGKRHERTDFDRARDEMFSLVHRCDVLEAEEDERKAWVKETVDYMAGRYPSLKKMELVKLETVGRNFCAPVISYGQEQESEQEPQEQEQVQAA